ncbi:MAG: ABC transporter substrate-binding protein [Bacillaceae bacterium]|nr:ABC transporter substrate-binding protein [Bacillaceae bacterium]
MLMLSVAACGGGNEPASQSNSEGNESTDQTASETTEVIKIGGIFAASGGAAPLGKPEMDTVKMLVEQLNNNGGINGKKIDLIAIDSKSDQNEAALSMKRLLEQEKVVAVIGGTTSGNCLTMIPMAEKAKVPFFALGASKQINNPSDNSPREWTFKSPQGDDIVAPKVVEYLKDEGLTRVAWLNVANSFGTSGHEEFMKAANENGIEVVAEEEFEASVNDAKATLTRVKKADPQAIIVWGTAQESAVVTKNIRELGIEVPIIESHGIATKQFIELAGEASNGVIFPAGKLLVVDQLPDDDPQKEVLYQYRNDFEGKFGYEASTFGGHAYDAFYMLVNAIEKVGTDPEAIRAELEKTQGFVGTGGVFNMSPEDHNGLTTDALVMIEIQDGSYVLKK